MTSEPGMSVKACLKTAEYGLERALGLLPEGELRSEAAKAYRGVLSLRAAAETKLQCQA